MKFFKATCLLAAAAAIGLSSCSVLSRISPLSRTDRADDPSLVPPQDQRIALVDATQQVVVTPALQGVAFNLPGPTPRADWPVPGGTLEQSVEHVAAAPVFEIAWKHRVGRGSTRSQFITAPPVAAGGVIFTIDASARVTATEMTTGAQLWSRVLNPPRDRRSRLPDVPIPFMKPKIQTDIQTFGGGLAYADGRLFMTSGYRFVAALDARTGDMLWKTDVASPIHSAPTVAGGKVYSINTNNELETFDATTGQAGWQYQALVEPVRIMQASSPAISGDTIVAGFASGELVALQTANGNELWAANLIRASRTTALSEIRDIAGRPVIYQGDVFAGGHSGAFAAVNLRTGTERWRLPIVSIDTPWAAGDVVYVVGKDGKVYCINRLNGQVYWIQDLNDTGRTDQRRFLGLGNPYDRTYWTGAILASNRLITVSSLGEVVALDPRTGARIGSLKLGAPAVIAPIAVQGMVFVMLDNGQLVAIR